MWILFLSFSNHFQTQHLLWTSHLLFLPLPHNPCTRRGPPSPQSYYSISLCSSCPSSPVQLASRSLHRFQEEWYPPWHGHPFATKIPICWKPCIHYHCWRIRFLLHFCLSNLTNASNVQLRWQQNLGDVVPRLPAPVIHARNQVSRMLTYKPKPHAIQHTLPPFLIVEPLGPVRLSWLASISLHTWPFPRMHLISCLSPPRRSILLATGLASSLTLFRH